MIKSFWCRIVLTAIAGWGVMIFAVEPDFTYKNNLEFLQKCPDLAQVDTGALTLEEMSSLDPAALARKFDEEGPEGLDRLYARLTSGPMPQGFHRGVGVFLPPDEGLAFFSNRGLMVPDNATLKRLAETMWGGKFFETKARGQVSSPLFPYLKNRLSCTEFNMLVHWTGVDPKACKEATVEQSVVFEGENYPKTILAENLYMPAKVYCGQSLFDNRRESIIIDYAFGLEDAAKNQIPVDPTIDWLAGKKGLNVRDEIRQVRPGLYLGRAYLNQMFLLFFVLEYVPGTGIASQENAADACWVGHQRQQVTGRRLSNFGNF